VDGRQHLEKGLELLSVEAAEELERLLVVVSGGRLGGG